MAQLRTLIDDGLGFLLTGDLILTEVLQGVATEREALSVERAMRRFEVVSLVGPTLAIRSAQHYRALRRIGITVRKTVDMLIATFCIEHGHVLLHSDRDFDGIERHLGLQVLRG